MSSLRNKSGKLTGLELPVASMVIDNKQRIARGSDDAVSTYYESVFATMLRALLQKHPVGNGKMIRVDLSVHDDYVREVTGP